MSKSVEAHFVVQAALLQLHHSPEHDLDIYSDDEEMKDKVNKTANRLLNEYLR